MTKTVAYFALILLTIRRAVIVDKMSEREVAQQFGLAREGSARPTS